MKSGISFRLIIAPALMLLLLAAIVWSAEGLWGFQVLLNLEALAIVLIGTLGVVGASYPLSSLLRAIGRSLTDGEGASDDPRSAEVLFTGARAAVISGLAGTTLGLILILSSVADLSQLPRRIALALTCTLFGLFLSEFILAPMARRCGKPSAPRPPQ